jgi:hypothetical protein
VLEEPTAGADKACGDRSRPQCPVDHRCHPFVTTCRTHPLCADRQQVAFRSTNLLDERRFEAWEGI